MEAKVRDGQGEVYSLPSDVKFREFFALKYFRNIS